MTSRYDLSTPGAPLLHKEVLEIPPGSSVRVQVKDGGYIYYGVCRQDPSTTKNPDNLVLHKVVGTNLNDPTRQNYFFDVHIINSKDIAELEIAKVAEPEPARDNRPERMMVTKVVSRIQDVKNIMDSIREKNLKIVVIAGLMDRSKGSGRFSKLGWLCLEVCGLLVCMDIVVLRNNEDFWKLMEAELFRNEEITKVCHNGKDLVDYLYHQHVIKIHNLFDTQIAEVYIRYHQNRDKMPAKVEDFKKGSSYNWEYYPVSKIYNTFVPELLLPEELEHLKKYEGDKFLKNSPYIQRPIPAACPHHKCSALGVKYLREVYDAQIKILLSHFTLVMTEQMKVMTRGGNTASIERNYIPHNVMEMMKEGAPFLSSDRSQDYIF